MSVITDRPLRPDVDPDRSDVRLGWTVLLGTLALVPVVYSAASPRVFAHGARAPIFGAVSASFARSMALLLILGLLAVCGTLVVLALPTMRLRLPRHGRLALASAVATGAAVILSGLAHRSAALELGLLAAPATYLTVGVIPKPSLPWFEAQVRTTLRVLIFGSLAAVVVAGGWAVQRGYDGFLPTATRLVGLASHANTLGPIAVASIVFEWRRPDRQVVPLGAAMAVLVWSQSKTSLAALVVIAAVVGFERLRGATRERTWMPVLALLVLLVATGAFALDLAAPGRQTDRTETSAETFTGRTAIWEVTIEVWQADPLVGYGPDLWNDRMDARYRSRVGFAPGQAHNQLLQTLGTSGLVGGAALVLLLASLAVLARAGHQRTGGLTTALVVLLAVRCLSESPLDGDVINMNFFLAVVTFSYLLIAASETDRAGA